MPAPLIATALTSIGAYLAKNGLDLLAGIFRGAVDDHIRAELQRPLIVRRQERVIHGMRNAALARQL